MGVQVYKARWHGTCVAAKVLKSNDPTQIEEFTRECAILRDLRHLHVVQFYAHIVFENDTVGNER